MAFPTFALFFRPFGVLSRDVYLDLLRPFVIICIIGLLVAWLSQALRLLEFVFANGASFDKYLVLTLLTLVPALNVVIPASFFLTIVYYLAGRHRSGINVAVASHGISPLQASVPLLVGSVLVMAVVSAIAIFMVPSSEARLRQLSEAISADFIASIVKVGNFNSPRAGITFFVRERKKDGTLHDVIAHDRRNEKQITTYSASIGHLVQREDDQVLMVLQNGTLVSETAQGHVHFLGFDNYSIDLSQFVATNYKPGNSVKELDISQLRAQAPFSASDPVWKKLHAQELYGRLSVGIYTPAMVILCCVAFRNVRSSRQRIADQVIFAVIAALAVRLIGVTLTEHFGKLGEHHWVILAFPTGVSIACLVALIRPWARRYPTPT